MATEADFRRWIKQNKPKDALVSSVETNTQTGVPDVFSCYLGVSKWIECKHFPQSKDRVAIRVSQFLWLQKLARNGGQGVIAIKRGPKKVSCYSIGFLRLAELSEYKVTGEIVTLTNRMPKPFAEYEGKDKEKFIEKVLTYEEDYYEHY